ncbi:MAG TPA: hypothetical protein GX515_08235, partial [Firmicutes bacterium]|nr:hypothetical protein [Bacillota bacterium]
NIGDAKNMLAVAESSLSKINDILLVVRDKAEQAASDTLGDAERTAITDQIKALLEEINTIVDETEWNGQKLIAGGKTFNFQTGFQATANTGVNMEDGHKAEDLQVALGQVFDRAVDLLDDLPTSLVSSIAPANTVSATELESGEYSIEVAWDGSTTGTIAIKDSVGTIAYSTTFASTATEVDTGVGIKITLASALPTEAAKGEFGVFYTKQDSANSVSSHNDATAYMRRVDAAIQTVSASVKDIGAIVSRLTFKEENLTVAKTNTEAAYNRIMNADIAAEQLEAMKYQILQQTATAMLAQANVAPQAVLGLFR